MSEQQNEPPQGPKPVDWDELYPGRFMKGTSIAEGAREVVTITSVDTEELPDDKTGKDRLKGILSFRETPLKLALNKTNGILIKAILGRDLTQWIGKRIVLHRDKYKGEPCVRVYGSPELAENITVPVKLPKKAVQQIVLYAPRRPNANAETSRGTTP